MLDIRDLAGDGEIESEKISDDAEFKWPSRILATDVVAIAQAAEQLVLCSLVLINLFHHSVHNAPLKLIRPSFRHSGLPLPLIPSRSWA